MRKSAYQNIRITVLTLSTILFPITFYYLSPVVSLHGGSVGIVTGSVMVFLLQFGTSMVLGRAFCSWICPGGGIQDHVSSARTRRIAVRRIGWLKYVVWGVWLGPSAGWHRSW